MTGILNFVMMIVVYYIPDVYETHMTGFFDTQGGDSG